MSTEQAERNPMEMLAEDFAEKCRRGQVPSIEEYVRNFPHLEKEIRELLPTVAIMEGLKKGKKLEPLPERIGEYQIVREIGRGGMGVVYEAEHKALGRRVALKVAAPHLLREPNRLERFKREAQAAARLHHTNIVPVFGAGESNGQNYIVMQHITGCGLYDVLCALRTPTLAASRYMLEKIPAFNDPRYWNWLAQIGVQVADALGYAHEQGTLHRDIKPANILLDARGIAWVADFGLAKIVRRGKQTQTGEIIGTVQYMAPEACRGQADARSDIYGLALTLYELATLQPPYKEMNMLDMLQFIDVNAPPRPRSLNPQIPADLESIILKGSARDNAQRYQNAHEMAADLRRFIEDRPIAARPVHAPERFWRWCRRNRSTTIVTATAAALLACALLGGWAGYVSTRNALESEAHRRAGADAAQKTAEETVLMSVRAFDEIYAQLDANFDDSSAGSPQRPNGPAEAPPRRDQRPNQALWQSVLNFYQRFAENYAGNAALEYEVLKASARVSEIQLRLNDVDKAIDTATHVLPAAKELQSKHADNADFVELLGQAHTALGSAQLKRRQFASAEDNLRKAMALGIKLNESMPTLDRYQIALARQRFALGECLANAEKLDEARKLIENSIDVLQPLADREPRLRSQLGREYNCLADLLNVLGDSDGSQRATQAARRYTPRPREFRGPGPDRDRDRPPRDDFEPRDRRRPE